MSREIVIRFRPDGSQSVEARGFAGPECYKATAPYEADLKNTKVTPVGSGCGNQATGQSGELETRQG